MVMLNYDATGQPTMDDFTPVENGDYESMAVKSEMKETKGKDGQFLKIDWLVLEGPNKGRSLFSRLNLINKNEQTVQIARRELNSICVAVGKLKVRDSAELHNIPVMLHVVKEARGDGKGMTNRITGYEQISFPASESATAETFPDKGAPAPAALPTNPYAPKKEEAKA